MTALKVSQIKKKLLTTYQGSIDMHGITEKDPNREVKTLSRCLAALAVENATGCSSDDAGKSVWDSGDDNGIDAAFYDSIESEVILVQSKFIQSGSGEPEARDISSFIDGSRDLIDGTLDNFGARLHPKVQNILDALGEPGTTVRLIVVSTGKTGLASHAQNKIDRFLNEINGVDTDCEDRVASTTCLGLNEVYSQLSQNSAVDKVTVKATILDWSHVPHPYTAYFGTIDGSQLKEWWKIYGKRLVAKNIRHALGATDVNNQIHKTASELPEHFWYYNNGITLIAEEISKAPAAATSHSAGNFELKGASIVNGAQTVSTLSRVEDDEALGKTKVHIRIINLKSTPADFGTEVTRTNNLQNRIEGRDFVSSDPEQERIRSEMAMESIEYQIHRNESFNPSNTSCDLIEVTIALACAHDDSSHAVAAKTGIGRFYNDLSKSPYKAIFNKQTNGPRAFNAVRIMREIDKWILEKKSSLEKKSGYQWGTLIHGNRLIASGVFRLMGQCYLDHPIGQAPENLSEDIKKACEKSYEKILESLNTKFPNKTLAVLFKSPSNCKTLYENIIH